jgi:hypothetical protein
MKEYIAERLSYVEIERRVREMGNYKPEISISEDGYWVIDGVKTDFKAEVGEAPVQSVNGKTGNVELSATDVGARPYNWTPTAKEVGARPDTWMPSFEDVGAEKSGAAASLVNAHNTNTGAHHDIRLELQSLANRINAALDSDDTTLDALSEIVAYIKHNKSLIDGITTSKVNVADIIDNLTTNMADKPLSAAQGVALKAFIDGKLDASALTTAINTALAQAKDSGEFDGEDGVGISSIANTGTNGNVDTYTITLSNGDTVTFTITNGTNGENGTNGKTPVYGVDYFTPEDIANIVKSVHESIGTPIFGIINAEKEILLSGKDVPIDNYTVAYINEDGSKTPIGILELDTNVYYPVTKTLTYCTISNSATKVAEGESYNATITANSGYELSSVKVTMGGSPVSVSGGVIYIESVTGDIVITAVAEEKVAATVNQIPISTDEYGNLLVGANGEKGYLANSRISSSDTSGKVQAMTDCEVTGFIPFKNGDVLRGNAYTFSNIGNDGSTSFKNTTSYNNITCFNANRQRVGSVKWDLRSTTVAGLTVNADSSFVFDSNANGTVPSTTAYIRVSLINITSNSIITVNQEIT